MSYMNDIFDAKREYFTYDGLKSYIKKIIIENENEIIQLTQNLNNEKETIFLHSINNANISKNEKTKLKLCLLISHKNHSFDDKMSDIKQLITESNSFNCPILNMLHKDYSNQFDTNDKVNKFIYFIHNCIV